jgi:MFS family permease
MTLRNPKTEKDNPQADQLPPQIRHAYWFQGFNAASWQICLGSPLILFARELGAPAVVLGILAGLAPLTSVLQLAVARYAERAGYRDLMVKGWSSRVAVLVFLVALPLVTPYIGNQAAIVALLAIMFVFTVSRAAGMVSWLPWITSIVPKSLRGFYLSRDRMFIGIASLTALTISGTILLGHSMWGYAAMFFIGFAAGVVSLYFLNRVPVPPAPNPSAPRASNGVQWRSVLQDKGFRRLVMFSMSVQAVVASSATFIVVFTREQVGIGDGPILWLTAGASLMGMLALTLLRHRADRVGSRPFLAFVFCWWVGYFALWFLLSIGGIPAFIAPMLLFVAGFFGSTYDLSLTRLLMNVAGDRPASAQYFALHSVVVSAVTGLSPIVWGFLLDNLRTVQITVAGVALNRYSYLFGLQWLMLAIVLVMLVRLKEPTSQPVARVAYDAFARMRASMMTLVAPTLSRLIRRAR